MRERKGVGSEGYGATTIDSGGRTGGRRRRGGTGEFHSRMAAGTAEGGEKANNHP